MMIGGHIAVSGVTGAVVYGLSGSWLAATACLLGGILIDLDHAFDFCLRKKRMCWRLSELEDFCLKNANGTIYVFFHSYELLIILWLSYIFMDSVIWLGFLVGVTVHMACDQMCNGVYPFAYFLLCRRKHGFLHAIFFKDAFDEILKGRSDVQKK